MRTAALSGVPLHATVPLLTASASGSRVPCVQNLRSVLSVRTHACKHTRACMELLASPSCKCSLRSALRGSGGKCARASGGLRASEQNYTFMQGRAQVLAHAPNKTGAACVRQARARVHGTPFRCAIALTPCAMSGARM